MTKRAAAHSRRRRQAKGRRRQQTGPLLLIGIGLLLIAGVAAYALAGRSSATASFDYGPEDVAYDQPLHAVHEMDMPGVSNKKPIPFLPRDGPQPKIVIPTTFYDFGTIGPTEVVKHDFVIANTGDAPLTISRAYTTCGCTTADLTSAIIPPGKVSIVTIVFDAGFHDVRGQTVRRGLIIENNDLKNPQMEIWIQARVTAS